MKKLFKKYKRTFISIGLAISYWTIGIIILGWEIEVTGPLFLLSGMATLAYPPAAWLLKKIGFIRNEKAQKRREITAATLLSSGLCFMGAVESAEVHLAVTALFSASLILILILSPADILKKLKQDPNRAKSKPNHKYRFLFFILIGGIILILFESENAITPFVVTLFAYVTLTLYWSARWIKKQVTNILMLKGENKRTELLHLQNQVNPHFFFNTLNNLYGLIDLDPVKAKEMVLKLSDMMRYSIYEGQNEAVTVAQEIAYLQDYITLHQARYRKEIKIGFGVEIEDEETELMPLLLIILLENAFKHGVENLREDASVYLELTAKEDELSFIVENTFDPEAPETETGIGLENLSRRLELAYPDRHSLSTEVTDNVYQAKLTLKL